MDDIIFYPNKSKINFNDFDFFEAFEQSLNEIIEFKKGDKTKASVTVISTPIPEYNKADISRIRKKLHLSQRGLANILGVSKRTVEAWEFGKSIPNGSAARLLFLIDNDDSEFQVIKRLISTDSQD